MQTLYTHDFKIVAMINKTLEPGPALNAIAHLSVGLLGRLITECPDLLSELNYQNFRDASGEVHPFISGLSLIVLRGSSNEIRRLREDITAAGLLTVDFHHQMTGESYVEQLERSAQTLESELIYSGVIVLAPKTEIDPLTRKYSLWR